MIYDVSRELGGSYGVHLVVLDRDNFILCRCFTTLGQHSCFSLCKTLWLIHQFQLLFYHCAYSAYLIIRSKIFAQHFSLSHSNFILWCDDAVPWSLVQEIQCGAKSSIFLSMNFLSRLLAYHLCFVFVVITNILQFLKTVQLFLRFNSLTVTLKLIFH